MSSEPESTSGEPSVPGSDETQTADGAGGGPTGAVIPRQIGHYRIVRVIGRIRWGRRGHRATRSVRRLRRSSERWSWTRCARPRKRAASVTAVRAPIARSSPSAGRNRTLAWLSSRRAATLATGPAADQCRPKPENRIMAPQGWYGQRSGRGLRNE